MTTLEEKIQQDLITAAKEKNELKLSTLRLIKTEIQKARTAEHFDASKFDDEAVKNIMRDMCKERTKTADIAISNGRPEFAEKELAEKKIIIDYLPKQATDDEVLAVVNKIIEEAGAKTMKDIGIVMKKATAELGDTSDGKTISTIVKARLSE